MTDSDAEPPPTRTDMHRALEVFVGEWRAEGTNYGIAEPGTDPRSNRSSWNSTHVTRWHSGKFFLIDDERARNGENEDPFDTIGITGVDSETGRYFAQSFENHG